MLPFITAWLIAFLSIFLLFFTYYFIIKPLIGMKFYTDQGIPMSFFPLLGNIKGCLDALNTTNDFYGHWIRQVRKNPNTQVIGGNLLDRPHLTLVDPKLIKDFYRKQENYIKLPKVIDLVKLMTKEGLATSEGEVWKRHRKLIASAFQFDLLRDMVPNVVKIADQFLEDLKNEGLDRVDITQEAEMIAGEVIGRLFFGEEFTTHEIQGKPVIVFLSDLINKLGSQGTTLQYLVFGTKLIELRLLPKYCQLLKDLRDLQTFSFDVVEKKKNEAKTRDVENRSGSRTLIDVLISQDHCSEHPFSTQEIVDEFVTFVAAGSNTTGNAVGRAIYYLSQNPQYKERLMGEINKDFEDLSSVTLDSLNQMEFMTAFIKETLRFAPPLLGLIDREAVKDHMLGNIKISRGTAVNVGALLNNFNPAYHEDEDVFYPERWLTNSRTMEAVTQNPFVYIPFSSGARNCMGQHLAMNEVRIIFSLFLKKYDFELDPDYNHKMIQRIVYGPVNPVNFKLTQREV